VPSERWLLKGEFILQSPKRPVTMGGEGEVLSQLIRRWRRAWAFKNSPGSTSEWIASP